MGINETANYILFYNPISSGAADIVKLTAITVVESFKNIMLRVASFFKKLENKTHALGNTLGNLTALIVPKPQPPTTVVMEPLPLWQLASSGGYYVKLAGILGASAVALGAYGAHSTFPKDDKIELKEVFERANKYHFIHSLAMLGVPLCRYPKTSGTFFMLGIAMFSGTCYYLALTGDRSFNKITPIGGICFILGWLALAL
ncbi:transmembrane protein 256 homolog isoform X1 [Homalodisca vitripennis]|uniref:transmembrane protein 256 homolog isoform X1 n=1 Tax=Homalodisca vitripennis TaxID=197043 RepID=UPI001EE9E784|nr:transmembrane protein 256 homolog isoform X1 [Homalodisca vitripennis]